MSADVAGKALDPQVSEWVSFRRPSRLVLLPLAVRLALRFVPVSPIMHPNRAWQRKKLSLVTLF
jgi:hypothetical protein